MVRITEVRLYLVLTLFLPLPRCPPQLRGAESIAGHCLVAAQGEQHVRGVHQSRVRPDEPQPGHNRVECDAEWEWFEFGGLGVCLWPRIAVGRCLAGPPEECGRADEGARTDGAHHHVERWQWQRIGSPVAQAVQEAAPPVQVVGRGIGSWGVVHGRGRGREEELFGGGCQHWLAPGGAVPLVVVVVRNDDDELPARESHDAERANAAVQVKWGQIRFISSSFFITRKD